MLPWIVASQTVPVLAIAMYLCFFPVTVAMVQGLRSPQRIETEMLHTYAATRWQTLWLLRLPAALPFLFPALLGLTLTTVVAGVERLVLRNRPQS